MLILSRRLGKKTFLTVPPSKEPTQIVVTIVRDAGPMCSTKIGFEAPREVEIHRDDAIHKEPKK